MDLAIVEEISKEYGTPFYLFDSGVFENNFCELRRAYEAIYSKFQIAYSFKTNYMPAACKKILSLGGWAEVVSDMEYLMARKYGFNPNNIIVNGPGKWYGIETMVLDGALVMLDNAAELDKVIEVSKKYNRKANIGFRLNLDIGTNKQSRFGFDVSSREFEKVLDKALKNEWLNIMGIHFHLGGARGLEAWGERARQMIRCYDELFCGCNIKLVDLGSGMFGHVPEPLAKQFNQYIPSFSEYAQVVASQFAQRFKFILPDDRPVLIVEPGATLIANSMMYITSVVATKAIRNRNIAMVDGSVHQLGELGKKKKLPVEICCTGNSVDRMKNIDITGYTCLEDDILYRNLDLDIGQGDLICFANSGAYTNVMKPPFIQVGCKIIEVDKERKVRLVKRQETIKDILSSYYIM